jgi:hypothetical protein
MKAGELLAQAYSAPQLSISTTELTAPDAPTTQTIAAAVNYMLRMSWIRAVPETNSFALTQEGIQHIEQSLAF